MKKPLFLILAILFIDQVFKIWIKTNFHIGEEISLIGNWAKLHFIENEGMAFGMSFGGEFGKLALTLFRIIASVLIFIYLRKIIDKKESKLNIYSISLIFAGAVGNIIDSIFYGIVFSESTYFSIAEIFPSNGGYGTLLHGKVVDMFYFPIINTSFPTWMPFIGGEPFTFFNAIFNIADISISVGVGLLVLSLLFFQKKEENIEKDNIKDSKETL
ncbi:MAG: lipoprotein signal peptidase [Bacteroidales bacterium]|jgi:signal peptidase II|nr:lipoprotein signal peptidase [Bacteroidales bacterium]MDY0053470.1 lipoprotein signal peptidase [Bacteroidales bacterium]